MVLILIGAVVFTIYFTIRSIINFFIPVKPKDLKGQVVLITGGGKGLGKQLALKFAAKRCKLAIVDVDIESAEDTARQIGLNKAKAYKADVSSLKEIENLRTKVEHDLGTVDILVNNAGLLFEPPFFDATEADHRRMIDVNLMSMFWTTKVFLPGMIDRQQGHIVSIASLFGLTGLATAITYTASKFAVRGFMETLALDMHCQGHTDYIHTTTVCPYFIATNENLMASVKAGMKYTKGILKVERAAHDIVEGVCRNEEVIVLPSYMKKIAYDISLPLSVKKMLTKMMMKEGYKQRTN